ncbi:MAG: hypothetical protein ACR2GD_00825 [Pyrinomonadaceae bacterium]
MNNAERLAVIELAAKFMKAEYRQTAKTGRSLRQSAEMMRDEYLNDKNLTVLSDLDGEDFIDA